MSFKTISTIASVCPAAIMQILDCTILRVGLHNLSFGLHKLVGLHA